MFFKGDSLGVRGPGETKEKISSLSGYLGTEKEDIGRLQGLQILVDFFCNKEIQKSVQVVNFVFGLSWHFGGTNVRHDYMLYIVIAFYYKFITHYYVISMAYFISYFILYCYIFLCHYDLERS